MKSQKNKLVRIPATAFVAGIFTLGLEIIAGRVLAPFFGSSLHQWAALIGTVLLAYVLGYETYHKINRKGPLLPLVLAGAYTLSLPFWVFPVLEWFLDFPLSVASVLGALITTGLPSILWASILPFLQKQKEVTRASRVLAWSTAGNLAGVWGVAFLSIPNLGTRYTLMSLGFFSIALGLAWMKEMKALGKYVALLVLVGLGSFSFYLVSESKVKTVNWGKRYLYREDTETQKLNQYETAYQQVTVWKGRVGVEDRTAFALNGNVQFIWTPEERLSPGERYEYYNYATAAAFWGPNGPVNHVLSVGVAGALIPWQISQFLPKTELTGFELDSQLVRISQQSLPLSQIPSMKVLIGDGRNLLRQSSEKFDYVFGDAFMSGYVPFHLTTREFFETVRDRMTPGGIFATNLHTVFEASGLLTQIERTMASVFKTVVSLDLPSGITLVLASGEKVDFKERFLKAADSAPSDLKPYHLNALHLIRQVPPPIEQEGPVLTDDQNDTEQRLYETRKYIMVKRLI